MSITAFQVNNGLVTPVADRKMYSMMSGDAVGVLSGLTLTSKTDRIGVSNGWGIIRGCIFQVRSEDIDITLSPSGTLKGRIGIRLDVNTPKIEFFTQAASNLPALIQENINDGGAIYEMELGTYTVNGVQITSSITRTAPTATLKGYVPTSRKVAGKPLTSDIAITAADVTYGRFPQDVIARSANRTGSATGGVIRNNVVITSGSQPSLTNNIASTDTIIFVRK